MHGAPLAKLLSHTAPALVVPFLNVICVCKWETRDARVLQARAGKWGQGAGGTSKIPWGGSYLGAIAEGVAPVHEEM